MLGRVRGLALWMGVSVLVVACSGEDSSPGGNAGSGGVGGSNGGSAGTSSAGAQSGGSAGSSTAGASGSGGAAGAAAAGGSGGAVVDPTLCLPFEKPSVTALRASQHKVFAHYFSQFPISIDNKSPDSDYYANNYLSPHGESDKWLFCGGFLRDRPEPVEPNPNQDWQKENLAIEVGRATAMGVDGFAYDMLSTSGTHWDRLLLLAEAIESGDAGFKILLMPDMYATFTGDDATATNQLVTALSTLTADHASVLYTSDAGKLVLAPYGAEKRTAAWWKTTLAALESAGISVDFLPLFSNTPWHAAAEAMQSDVTLFGVASWGTRTPGGTAGLGTAPQSAHDLGLLWMAPVAPQDMRPKDLNYWEAGGSETLRKSWEASIQGGADWVQLVTWNDYSEHSHVAPSLNTGYAFADLSAYYATWFKAGTPPSIVRDRLYYFQRVHSTAARPDSSQQTGGDFTLRSGSDPARDQVELVAFLTEPGTLEIELAGATTTFDAPAGLTSFTAPLAEGTPVYRLKRSGAVVRELRGAPITDAISTQDPLYHAGSSSDCTR